MAEMTSGVKLHPHAPAHLSTEPGAYIVTAGTYQKAHVFRTADSLDMLVESLKVLTKRYGWSLLGYAAFSNHYHFVATSDRPENLNSLIRHLHSETSRLINVATRQQGRKVWHQYWDTYLDDSKALYSRLNYVLENPVRHGLVKRARDYRWCSALEFEAYRDDRPFVKTTRAFGVQEVRVADDYEPVMPDS
jgi:putative transposase